MPAQVKCPAHSFTATQARGPSAQSPTLRGNLASHFCLNSSLGGSIPQVTAAAHPQGKHHFSQPGQHLLPTAPFLAHPWQTIHPSEVPSVTAPEKPSIGENRSERKARPAKAGPVVMSKTRQKKVETLQCASAAQRGLFPEPAQLHSYGAKLRRPIQCLALQDTIAPSTEEVAAWLFTVNNLRPSEQWTGYAKVLLPLAWGRGVFQST